MLLLSSESTGIAGKAGDPCLMTSTGTALTLAELIGLVRVGNPSGFRFRRSGWPRAALPKLDWARSHPPDARSMRDGAATRRSGWQPAYDPVLGP